MDTQYEPKKRIRSNASQGLSAFEANPDQSALIRSYADRIGEKIGRLVSEIIVDVLTLLWMEKPANQPISFAREKSGGLEPILVQPKVDPSRLFKASDIANRLGVSKSKAYQMIQRGEIPTIRIGSSVRVRPQDLEDYIKKSLIG